MPCKKSDTINILLYPPNIKKKSYGHTNDVISGVATLVYQANKSFHI